MTSDSAFVFRRLPFVSIVAVLIGLASLLASGAARAQLPPGQPFELYGVHDGIDGLGARIQTGDIPWKRICAIWESHMGLHPEAGPHMIMLYPGGKEAFYTAHIAALAADVIGAIPDPNYNGLVAVDIETWNPWWTWHVNEPSSLPFDALDYDKPDDWRDYIRQYEAWRLVGMTASQQQEVFRQTWLATTREYYTRTVNEFKRLRPFAKFGLYAYPQFGYHDPDYPGSLELLRIRYEDETPWLLDLFDVMMPSCYWQYFTVASNPNYPAGEDAAAEADRYLRYNIEQAKRLSHGKPVYIWVSTYYCAWVPNHPLEPVNNLNMHLMIETPMSAGADGVVVWDVVSSEAQLNNINQMLNSRFNPYMTQMLLDPRIALGRQYVVRQPIPGTPAARAAACWVDIVGAGGEPTRDGLVSIDDLVAYLGAFFAGNTAVADCGGAGGTVLPDGQVTIDDLVLFLAAFFRGCP